MTSASRSSSSSGLLPMPGTAASSWAVYRARLGAILSHPQLAVVVAFWLFGLINNVLYVIILSAAQDLVGSTVPKGVVLLADVLPSFFTKLIAPYFIHRVPYSLRVVIFIGLSAGGMLLVALTPAERSVAIKMAGVILASLSSGGGELSFLGLTHYYGQMSLAGWGSGTGAAGLVGAGLYVLMTDWIGFSVRATLLFSACLPSVMFVSFFMVLPRGPLRAGSGAKRYENVPERDLEDEDIEGISHAAASSALLSDGPSSTATAYSTHSSDRPSFRANLRRVRALMIPYMIPLLLVFVSEYTINQGVTPTLLFPLPSTPFTEFRAFYPFYSFLYQLGVFISRSSTPFVRIRRLYLPSILQAGNLGILLMQALYFYIPSVYMVFGIIFWEGLLGGAVYVNSFANILEEVPAEDREFSLSATSVSDSAGICIAGLLSILIEPRLCDWQVTNGVDFCRNIDASRSNR